MATNPPPTPTLPCKECGYANEPERVYCHNCGAKLDRSILPKEEEVRRESPEKARRRIMRMANPSSSSVKREIGAFFKTLFFAALAACIVQCLRPPDGIPSTKSMGSRILAMDMGDVVQAPVPKAVNFTEDEINAYLRSKVQGKSSIPGVEFRRLYVNLQEGAGRVAMEKTV